MPTVCLVSSPAPSTPGRQAAANLLAEHITTGPRLPRLALRLLGDPNRVDDVVQDAYLRVFRALPRFQGNASLGTWLYRIVHNLCIDELRRSRRPGEVRDDEALAAPAPDPSDVGVDHADLGAGLAALSQKQRAAVVLVDGYGVSYVEAAKALGVPVGTVASRAFRARTLLRQALATDAA